MGYHTKWRLGLFQISYNLPRVGEGIPLAGPWARLDNRNAHGQNKCKAKLTRSALHL